MSQDNAHDAAEGQEREGNADFRHGRRGGFSRDGGRERGGRPAAGGNGVTGIIREALGTIEKSLTTADFERISGGLNRIAEALRPLHLKSVDEIDDFDARTHLFTALLRAGRLAPGKDEAHEAQRRDMLAAVGEVWLALGDEEKSDAVLEAAGRPERTILRLERTGHWQEAAERALQAGNLKQAAQILDAHGDKARAFELFRKIGTEPKDTLRLAAELGKTELLWELAQAVPSKAARAVLFQFGQEQLFLELAARRGEWHEVARLYEQAGQHADAAFAFERSGDIRRALECFRRGGRPEEAARLLRQEAARRMERGNVTGAGDLLRRQGMADEAVALVRETHPELAFKWLEHAGKRDRAREFAAEMVGRLSAGDGDPKQCAVWLERSGQKARAAEMWLQLGEPDSAMRNYEAAGEWKQALAIAVQKGDARRIQSICDRGGLPFPEGFVPGARNQRLTERSAPLTVPTGSLTAAAPLTAPPSPSPAPNADKPQTTAEASAEADGAQPSKEDEPAQTNVTADAAQDETKAAQPEDVQAAAPESAKADSTAAEKTDDGQENGQAEA